MVNKFDSKGVDEGDPIAIALFFFMAFVMFVWLLTPGSSPLPSSQINATFTNFLTQFRFILGILVPIAVIALFRQFSEGTEAEQFKQEVRDAQFAFTRGLSSRISEFNARQGARRKPRKGPLTESETL